MENTTLLFELLDGTLESVREEAVFRELAVNEELRMEFRQISAMRNAVQSDAAAFVPPAESTVAIFRRLGFVPPAAPAAGLGAKFAAAAGNYTQAIIGGLTMTAVTAAAFFLLFPARQDIAPIASGSKSYESGMVHSPAVEQGLSSEAGEILRNSAEFSEKHPGNRADFPASTPPREVIRYVYVNRPELATPTPENTLQTAANEPSPITNPQENIPVIAFADSRIAHNIASTSLLSGSSFNHNNPSLLPQFTSNTASIPVGSSSLPSFEIGIRRLDSRSIESPTIADISQSIGNNLAFTAMWLAADDWKVGLEIAREEFFQRFETSEIVKDTTFRRQYEQLPSLWSAGVAGQYTLAEWGQFSPFAQASVGLSGIGPIGRFGLGLRYSPEALLSFVLRFEAAGLQYSEQGTSYFSGKYGVSYGMNLSF